MGGQSGSWTPTKRRGPIAAEFQGPGPAALSLPSLFGSKCIKCKRMFLMWKSWRNDMKDFVLNQKVNHSINPLFLYFILELLKMSSYFFVNIYISFMP